MSLADVFSGSNNTYFLSVDDGSHLPVQLLSICPVELWNIFHDSSSPTKVYVNFFSLMITALM